MSDPAESPHPPIPPFIVLSMVGLAVLGAVLSPFACIVGATLTGLKEGGWNWQYLGYFAIGLYAGVVIAMVCLGIGLALYGRRPELGIWLPLIGPLILVFIIGAVTFPIQAAQERRSTAAFREQQSLRASFWQQLAEDPAVVIRERWLEQDDLRPEVLRSAMSTSKNAPFTTAHLTEIYDTWEYPLVILHPACSREFLEAHLETILRINAQHRRPAHNAPNLRLDYITLQQAFAEERFSTALLQHIASLEHLSHPAVHLAKGEVNRREAQRQLEEALARYRHQAQQDPSVVIRERWLDDPVEHRAQAVHTSMAEGTIPFSEEQLTELLNTWHYSRVVLHPSCTHDFLERYLAPALSRNPPRHREYVLLLSDLKFLFAREIFPADLLDRIVNETYANDRVERHELARAARAAREVSAQRIPSLTDEPGSDAEDAGNPLP